ncbi:TetR family transcriptional regulator [Sphingomonas ginsenosidimutans]|jgi:AcrR family transcriptional regulator|uniref:TetR family transcriptional regulator n=1 Tax=Sphingomonas ginsenosidimutans TaxID=862134 RepID=A0A2A4I0S4_9SPHN|nr:TetR/AcrR family transcriptional regulator [Sphingomonas ginsenosidimutans]MEE2917105.1 helix-turn-helix domain-containing protein [Pseudomonadota bacterium]PCG10366.1 TetR family transcriptional regulator [Sphingomonas ginsenosidimutans]
MTVPRPSSPATRGGATRNELKRAARRLFAERGIAAVGMREVVEAAGQRNAAAVHYYFGSKDDLLRELLIDGADLIEARRKALIDDAERKGAGMTLRDLVEAIVLPNVELRGDTGEEETYFRFIVNVQNERRELFRDTVPEHSDSYRRYVDHVRRLLTPLPVVLANQRVLFAGLAMQTLVAAREAALDRSDNRDHHFWSRPDALTGIIDAMEAILLNPAAS